MVAGLIPGLLPDTPCVVSEVRVIDVSSTVPMHRIHVYIASPEVLHCALVTALSIQFVTRLQAPRAF